MRNPLQDQLLKAGLVKKGKVAQVVREQNRKRQGKGGKGEAADKASVDGRRLQAERAERDRALAAERNAQARAQELRAQVRQLIEAHRQPREGDIAYRFSDGATIKSIWVDQRQRRQLAAGALVIVRHDEDYELLPREAAEKVREREPEAIVLDHGSTVSDASGDEDDEYYRRFQVPDDLIW